MDTEEIAEAWRSSAVSTDVWTICENQAGLAESTAQGLYMECESTGWRRAYVKPKFRTGLPHRAAHEKIASDLAHDLDVSVPPVILVDRNDAGLEQHRYVAASLVMFKQQYSWDFVKSFLEQEHSAVRKQALRTAGRDAARALAFDTWIGQEDHHSDHPSNILLGWNVKELSRYVFIDYEFGFGATTNGWQANRAREIQQAPFPVELLEKLDLVELDASVAAIESTDDQQITDIVSRIPQTFLDTGTGNEIIVGLLARRSLVRQALRATLQE